MTLGVDELVALDVDEHIDSIARSPGAPNMCGPSATMSSSAANCSAIAHQSKNGSVGFCRWWFLRALRAVRPDPVPLNARCSAKSRKCLSFSSSICSLRGLTHVLRMTAPKSSPPACKRTMSEARIAADSVSTLLSSRPVVVSESHCDQGVAVDNLSNTAYEVRAHSIPSVAPPCGTALHRRVVPVTINSP